MLKQKANIFSDSRQIAFVLLQLVWRMVDAVCLTSMAPLHLYACQCSSCPIQVWMWIWEMCPHTSQPLLICSRFGLWAIIGVQCAICWEVTRVEEIVSAASSRVVIGVVWVLFFREKHWKHFFNNKVSVVIMQKSYQVQIAQRSSRPAFARKGYSGCPAEWLTPSGLYWNRGTYRWNMLRKCSVSRISEWNIRAI